MKIVCPSCEAAYKVDLSSVKKKKVSFKCARCHSNFLVRNDSGEFSDAPPNPPAVPTPRNPQSKEESRQADPGENQAHPSEEATFSSGARVRKDDTGSAAETPPSFVDPAKENAGAQNPQDPDPPEEWDDNLDALLDDIIQEDMKSQNPPEVPEEPPGSEPPAESGPPNDNLDHLLDNLLNEESTPPSPEMKGEAAAKDWESAPVDPKSETELDTLLDDILQEGTAPPSKEKESSAKSPGTERPQSEVPDPAVKESSARDLSDLPASPDPAAEPQQSAEAGTSAPEDPATPDARATVPPESQAPDQEPERGEETAPSEPTDKATESPQPGASEEEDLWAAAFAEQEALNQAQQESASEEGQGEKEKSPAETPEPAAETPQEEAPQEEKKEEDLWAAAFAEQESLNRSREEDQGEESREENPDPPDSPSRETEEDESQTAEEKSPEPAAEEVALAEPEEEPQETPEEDSEESPGDERTEEEDFYGEEDDFGFEDEEPEPEPSPRKKKRGPFPLPATRTGQWILGGCVLALGLTGVAAYFALQALAPPELAQMGKGNQEVPEGLSPRANPEAPSPDDSGGPQAGVSSDPTKSGTAPLDPVPGGELGESPGLSQDLAQSEEIQNSAQSIALGEEEPSPGLIQALAPRDTSVTLATIMPVAFNVNDIRVLSFTVKMELTNEKSAQAVRQALPVFEKLTVNTVEELLDRKFYNDILYVKEKLQKELKNNYNQEIAGSGRVKRVKFKDFLVQ